VSTVQIAPASALRGAVSVPGDKSASHRALMVSALAEGTSTIEGLSPGEDVAATSRIMVQLGAQRHDEHGLVTVLGPTGGLRASSESLECGNSGTTMRLVAGIVSGVAGRHHLVGDASLSRRPMDRVVTPLTLMGATLTGQGSRVTAPLVIEGSDHLRSIDYHVPVPSAQVKSAVLLAALRAVGHSVVHESVRTRTTTEDMLRHAGVTVHSIEVGEGRDVTITPGRPAPVRWRIPGDPSQAAFFAVLGCIHDDAVIEVSSLDHARERVGFARVLARMGGRVRLVDHGVDSELHAASSQLEGTEIFAGEVPSVDEVPILAVAASAARGVSAFRDMGELRVKESDRFAATMELARVLGCRVWSEGDDFFIEGVASARAFAPFSFDPGLDHRMVMSAAVAGTAGSGCEITGSTTVASSYPAFFDDLASLQ